MNDHITFADVLLFLILLLTCPIWLSCLLIVWVFAIVFLPLLIKTPLPLKLSLIVINAMTLLGLPFLLAGQLGSNGFFHVMRKRPHLAKDGFTYRQCLSSKKVSWAEIAFIKWMNHIPDGDAYEFTLTDGSVFSFNSYVKIQYLLKEAKKAGVEIRRWDMRNQAAARE